MIQVQEYLDRRKHLLAQLQPNSIVIIAAATELTRSNDTEFHFRQHSDFFYLTGFNEPDAFLVMSNCAESIDSGNATSAKTAPTDKLSSHTIMFVKEKDELAEIWHGRRLGSSAAPAQLKIDMAYSVDDIDDILPELIDGADNLYFTLDQNMRADNIVQAALAECKNAPKQSKTAPHNIIDVSYLIHNMRLLKSSAEIAVMQTSADIACKAHKRAMHKCAPDVYEYQLEAHILHTFAMQGARFAAYNTIVGGGENACILHYTENSSVLNDGELVLIDAGAEYQGYASDITRTFPVNGRFSDAQKALYTIVLDAQLASMQLLKPGKTIPQAMQVAVEVITQGLLDLGILQGNLQDCIKRDAHKPFFMHGLGHYLGLDVHDVGPYKVNGRDILLEAGMALTVEPGIYIADNEANAAVPAQYKNIGIRIEDNIVISADGHIVLTSDAPKTVEDIEAFMATSAR